MTGNEHLHKQLDSLRDSLRAFEHPIVDEVPGLRLMQETLKEREQHIAQTIEKNETCTIELTLEGAAHGGDAVRATLVAYLLDAVAAAVEAAGLARASGWTAPPPRTDIVAALSCHLKDVSIDGGDAVLKLARPPGAVATQLADPATGAPLFEHAAIDAFGFSDNDAETVPPHLVPALHGLAETIAGGEFALRWSIEPFVLDAAEGFIDQTHAQRLAQRSTD
jgi:hypothetical protein